LPTATQSGDEQKVRIMLGLLESVERGGEQSQRRLASELGVALGLVNAYLKRCVSKGLVKVREAPTRRYAYYLTPRGFAEKSRLTAEYMAYSLSLFRSTKNDCAAIFSNARVQGWTRFAIYGGSELTEIAAICALNNGIVISAVVDPGSSAPYFVGAPRIDCLEDVPVDTDALLVTEVGAPRDLIKDAKAKFGNERVFVLDLLNRSVGDGNGGEK